MGAVVAPAVAVPVRAPAPVAPAPVQVEEDNFGFWTPYLRSVQVLTIYDYLQVIP